MIRLHRTDATPLLINEDHIVWVEGTHDTIIHLSTGEQLRVQEGPEEIARRVAGWRQRQALAGLLEPEPGDD